MPRFSHICFGFGPSALALVGIYLGMGCQPQRPAPLSPLENPQGEGEGQAEAASQQTQEMELTALPTRIGPNWLPAPLSEVSPKLGEGVRVMTPRVRIVPRPELSDEELEQLGYETPLDTVFAELVASDLSGEKVWLSTEFILDTEACYPEIELNELEGVSVAGHYMFQLTCGGGGDDIFVDSFTMLVRVDLQKQQAIVLWEGTGSSTNERDTCLTYDVVSFFASKDGKQVLAVRDREAVRAEDPEQEPQVVCNEREFEQLPAAEIDLEAPAGQGVTEFEVPEVVERLPEDQDVTDDEAPSLDDGE